MQIGNLLQNRLMGKTMKALQNALDYRAAKHSVIAGNLANIETPSFIPKKATFNQALRDAVVRNDSPTVKKVALQRTHRSHLPFNSEAGSTYSIETMESNRVRGQKTKPGS